MAPGERQAIDFSELYRRLDQAAERARSGQGAADRERVLSERAAALAKSNVQEVQEPGRDVLVFAVGGERYAVPIEHVDQVVDVGNLSVLPGAPPFVIGAMVARSRVVVVMDLRTLLGLERGQLTDLTQVVIVRAAGVPFGLAVESVEGRREVRLQEASSRPLSGPFLGLGADRIAVLDVSQLDDPGRVGTTADPARGG